MEEMAKHYVTVFGRGGEGGGRKGLCYVMPDLRYDCRRERETTGEENPDPVWHMHQKAYDTPPFFKN